MDIKRLPDGTSRGFAFVKFVEARGVWSLEHRGAEFERYVGEVDSIPKVLEAQSSHMLFDCVWDISASLRS